MLIGCRIIIWLHYNILLLIKTSIKWAMAFFSSSRLAGQPRALKQRRPLQHPAHSGTGSRAVKKKACRSNLQLPLPPRMTLVRTAHMLGLGVSYFDPTLQIIEQSRLQKYLPSDSKPETWHSDSILISSRDSAEFTLEMLLEEATLEKSNFPGPFCIQVVKSHNHGGQVMAGKVSALCLSSWNMQPVGSSTSSTAQIRPLCSL